MKKSLFLTTAMALLATPLLASAATKRTAPVSMNLKDAYSISCSNPNSISQHFMHLKTLGQETYYRTGTHKMENLKVSPWSLSFSFTSSGLTEKVSLKISQATGRKKTEDSGRVFHQIYVYQGQIGESSVTCEVAYEPLPGE